MITTAEMAERANLSPTTVATFMTRHNRKPKDVVHYNSRLWGEDDWEWFEKEYEKNVTASGRYVTLEELAEEFHVDKDVAFHILFDHEAKCVIGKYYSKFKAREIMKSEREKIKKEKNKACTYNPEEHPLVKDPKFFRLSYFPDAYPANWEK